MMSLLKIVGPLVWNFKCQVKLFCIIFLPQYYNALILSALSPIIIAFTKTLFLSPSPPLPLSLSPPPLSLSLSRSIIIGNEKHLKYSLEYTLYSSISHLKYSSTS